MIGARGPTGDYITVSPSWRHKTHQLIILTVYTIYRYETLYIIQIDHPESSSHQSALHIWVILLKHGRYCDMEVDNLEFNISYCRYCR